MKVVLPWILAASSGLVLALSMPGPGLALLAFAFPVLLLEALERTNGWWRHLLCGWVAGAVFWLVSTNWVVPVMHHYGGLPRYAAVNALFGMAMILGGFWAVAAAIACLSPGHWRIWLLPTSWVAIPILHQFPPFGFTWTSAAAAFVDWPWMMASLPVWGATGLAWWTAAVGAGLWGLLREDYRLSGAVSLVAACAFLACAALVAPSPTPAGATVKVAVLQPGTSLEEKWDPSHAREIADRVWAQTAAAAVRGADIVLWPESAVPFRLDADKSYRGAVERMADDLDVEIVLNSVAARADGSWANSAYLVTPDGVSPTRYDKVHLVPFGEFVPGWARFAFTDSLVREVGSFTPGSAPAVLPATAPLGVAICFEVVFGDLPAAQVRGGAQLLTTLTNDGWYGFSWAPTQHFAQVRLRAAENRRWFARAALTGISGFIDSSGAVVSSLDVGDAGFLIEEVQPLTGLTPRTRYGDWFAILCWLATAAIVAASTYVQRRGKRETSRE